MKKANISTKKKIDILKYYQSPENIRGTARKFPEGATKIWFSQILYRLKNEGKLQETMKSNQSACVGHKGRELECMELENIVYDWTVE